VGARLGCRQLSDAPQPEHDDVGRRVALAGHRGDTALARQHLAHADPRVRAIALRALQRAGDLQIAEWVSASTDPDPAVRRDAAEVAGRWQPDPPAAEALRIGLLTLLGDDDAMVVEMAAWATGERAVDADTVSRLIDLTVDHDDALVREAAVAALGSLGDAAGLPAILSATSDKATVRRRAVLALAAFEGPEVDAALSRAKDDRDWQVRQAAEDLLAP
jgi:HEAT repeat protein